MSPFTPYLVLIVHIVSNHSMSDLHLLASVISVFEPAAEYSPLVHHTLPKCRRLYQLAEVIARQHPENTLLLDSGSNCDLSTDLLLSGGNSGSIKSLVDWQLLSADLDLDVSWKPN